MLEKVKICLINSEDKRPNPLSSEEHVAQGVEICAKIVISNVEIDKSTTVDIDVKFELPLAGIGLLA